jgi:tetratricopeptide (TPR) repeat protein
MTDEERAKWAEAAVRLVDDAFPGGDFYQQPETWPLCNELLPHALSVAEHAEAFNVAKEQTARLLNQVGMYFDVLAQFTEAKKAYERALAIDEAAFGSLHTYE